MEAAEEKAASKRGLWMCSAVTAGNIAELQASGYLPSPDEVKCRSPLVGEEIRSASRVPERRAGECVVFISHLIRGLGFPVHPFLQSTLYFYGIQFHHLAPNSILHIASYIVFCEAFLHIEPHFGLWLKLFCVKPQTNGRQITECGGAMISKLNNVNWLHGKFIETVK